MYAGTACAEAHQSLESTSTNASNDSSQPDMNQANGMSAIALESAPPGEVHCADAELAPILGHRGHNSWVQSDAATLVANTGTSLFGLPSENAPNNRTILAATCNSGVRNDARLAIEPLAIDEVLREAEPYNVQYSLVDPSYTDGGGVNAGDDAGSMCVPDNEDDIDVTGDQNSEEDFDDFDSVVQMPEEDSQMLMRRSSRTRSTSKRGFTATWIDKDDSGNYDPKANRQRRKAKRARKGALGRSRSKARSEEAKDVEAARTLQVAERSIITHESNFDNSLATLTLTSEEGIESLSLSVPQATQESKQWRRSQREAETPRRHLQGSMGSVNLPLDFKNTPMPRSSTVRRSTHTEHDQSLQTVAFVPSCYPDKQNHAPTGVERTIVTSFSHPMGFNCDDEEPRRPCHFCIQPGLQILGFGKKETSIIDFDDSTGFVEVAGGHRQNFIEPTRLCIQCTTARLSITMCEAHTMTPIPQPKYTAVHQEWLLRKLYEEILEEGDIDAFCSLCTSIATMECSAAQEESQDGCGLKLCDRCSVLLVGQHEGDLAEMLVRSVKTPSRTHGIDFRADVELLMRGGSLMRYLAHLSRQ